MDRRGYLKHFAILVSGNAAAQTANLVSYPVLARLYTPDDFGVFAMFVAASAIPGAIACFRFDLAVPTTPRAGRFAILWLCFAISAAMGAATAVAAAAWWWGQGVDAHPLMPVLLGLVVFLTGFCAAASLYLMRHDLYRTASGSLLVRTGGAVAVQMALAFVWPHPMSLVIGYCLGFAAQAVHLGAVIWTRVPPRRPRLGPMRAMFRRYRTQVLIDVPSTLIAAMTINLMPFLLLILYNERIVGFFSLGNRIAIVPLQLFNDALAQVFFQKAARAQEERGNFWNEMKFNLLTSSLLSVGVLIGIWLLARPFVSIYLGREWLPAGDMLVILAPMLAIRSLCMSVATTVFVLRRPQWLLYHNIAGGLVMLLGFAVAFWLSFGVFAYLELTAALLAAEYAAFALFLTLASRRGRVRAALA